MARSARLLVEFPRKYCEPRKVLALLNSPEKEPRLPEFCETVFLKNDVGTFRVPWLENFQ